MSLARRIGMATSLIVLVGIQAAFAFVPGDTEDFRIPHPDRLKVIPWVKSSIEDPRVRAFSDRWGGPWWAEWNPYTGAAHHFHGKGIELTSGRALTPESAEAIARDFIAGNPEIFNARQEELRLADALFANGKCSVLLDQYYNGIPVLGGGVQLLFTENGRLFAFGSDFFPEIELTSPVDHGEEFAVAAAARDLHFNESSDEVLGSEPIIFPVLTDNGYDFHLCRKTTLRTESPMGIWVSFVDASSGEVLWRYNEMSNVNVIGNVDSYVEHPSHCDGESLLPMPHQYVTVVGGNQGTTDADGNFDITHSGSTPVTVEASLTGPYAKVIDRVGDDAFYSGTATPGVPLQIEWDGTNSGQWQRPAFWHTVRIHDWIKAMDPGWTSMDFQMQVYVRESVSPCPGNAWYDGGTGIHFCKRVGGYAATSRSGTIIYHEYTHGITGRIYAHGPTGDMNEGNSDIGSNILMGDSRCGNGWLQNDCDNNIRNSEHEMQYPDDLTGEDYHDGQILAGFYWHAFTNLWATYGGPDAARDILGPAWHFSRRLHRPATQPDEVYWTFVEDDDDGDFTNGCPHYEDLCAAAERHGYDCPAVLHEVTIAHERVSSTTDSGHGTTISADISSTDGGLDPAELKVYYSANEAPFVGVPLEPAKERGSYTGTIPAQDPWTGVRYYVAAGDSAGNFKTSPASVPYNYHTFGVGIVADSLESDSGWTVGDPTDSATSGIWVRVDPNGTTAQPEDDHTTGVGTHCYVTGDTTAGLAQGACDVDGGKTSLLTPVYNLSGAQDAGAMFSYWFCNSTGTNPWEDYFTVDVSNDGGGTWTTVLNTNVSTYSWVTYTVNLDSLETVFGPLDLVQFRFAASDTGLGSVVEAAVDDFTLLANLSGAGVAVDTPPAHRFWLGANAPNPFNPSTLIEYGIAKQGPVALQVYNALGQRVRTLVDDIQAPGHYAIGWDGTDERGRTVASGVYFYRLVSGPNAETRKMVLLK